MQVTETARKIDIDTRLISTNQICMAMLGVNGKPAHSLGVCKEYILDCVMYTHDLSDPPYAIAYGEVSLGETCLVVTGLKDRMVNSLDFVHLLESALGLPFSAVEVADDKAVVFCGDRRWQLAPPLLSLYALAIRVGIKHRPGESLGKSLVALSEGYDRDNLYVKTALPAIHCLLRHGVDIFDTEGNWARRYIHNDGIVSFAEGKLRARFPSWYKNMPGGAGSGS